MGDWESMIWAWRAAKPGDVLVMTADYCPTGWRYAVRGGEADMYYFVVPDGDYTISWPEGDFAVWRIDAAATAGSRLSADPSG